MRTPKPTAVAELKNSILNAALTTHYECWFSPPPAITDIIPNSNKDVDYTLSCMEASLPGTSLATLELTNDHTGITERHAYRRQYDTTSSFTFLVDRNYKQIQFFESWIGYIVNERNINNEGYFYRVNFPKQYKTTISINKFERDIKQPSLIYAFLNAYPISIDSMPVSYDGAQTLKCTVNFNFSRYLTAASQISPKTSTARSNYQVLGTSDSSTWVAGGSGGGDIIATTNKGAQAAQTFANSGIVLENQYNEGEL